MDPNFSEHVIEDGSVEYLIDWDAFSFEGELEARKKILEDQARAFKAFAESTKPDINDKQIQANEAMSNKLAELQVRNESTLSHWNTLMAEYKRIKENVEDLTAKSNSLKKTIKEFKEKETDSLKEYRQLKTSLMEGVKMYTTCFDIDVAINNLSDTTYEAQVRFVRGTDVTPIKFVVDRTERKVLDFNISKVLSPTEEEDIRKKFGDLDNLPALFHALREIILTKRNNAN